MTELEDITRKYDAEFVDRLLGASDSVELASLASTYFKDVAEIYDLTTRCRNLDRNPNGFSLADAPILGLLVRAWKALKLMLRYYDEGNAQFMTFVERPFVEACVMAKYLLNSDEAVVEDYRHCAYKDKLRILSDYEQGSDFFTTKAGKRLLASTRKKMALESLSPNSFETQKNNRWRLQGKSFFQIFSEVEPSELYRYTYGIMSEGLHGSWLQSLDWDLAEQDGTFRGYPLFHPPDVRFVSPLLVFSTPAYRQWLERIELADSPLMEALDWAERFNATVFQKFDELYGD